MKTKGNNMKRIIICTLLISIWSLNVFAQNLTAKVNRNQIPEGETFLLSVEFGGRDNKEIPNFKVLDKDFTVYSVSNTYQTNIVNGEISQSKQWNLVMMPKYVGKLIIPAITMDSYTTSPVEVFVTNATNQNLQNNNGNANAPRFTISGNVDNENPYVQQQINYNLTITDTGGLQGEEPIFMATNENDWIIKNLGKPIIDSKTLNGKEIREITFKYALFPQKSGKLQVPAVKFNGFYMTKETRNDPFADIFGQDMMIGRFGMADVFATREPVVLQTKAININVKEIAKNKVGEAISRTIYLKAIGVIDSQLPELKFVQVVDLKQYPEKPLTHMNVEDNKIISIKKIVNVYIPEKSGEMTLPAIEVDWFNINTNKLEKASLPAVKIDVKAGANSINSVDEQDATTDNAASGSVETKKETMKNEINIYHVFVGLLLAFALGVLISFLMIRKKYNTNMASNKSIIEKKDIILHAKNRKIKELRDALISWASQHFNDEKISSLNDVDACVGNTNFSSELNKLSEALYSKNNIDWNETKFIDAFEKICKTKKRNGHDKELLPKLYK